MEVSNLCVAMRLVFDKIRNSINNKKRSCNYGELACARDFTRVNIDFLRETGNLFHFVVYYSIAVS